jgi:hypothetical protein
LRPSGSDRTNLLGGASGCQAPSGAAASIARALAKKSRTPAPPRKVQAPQKRVEQRRPRTADERRTLWVSVAFAASGVAAIAIVAAIFFAFGRGGGNNSAPPPVNESELVGLQTGPAPWNAGVDHLPDRLQPLGLSQLGAEGSVIHIHQHLDIYVDGKHETVPAQIGIYDGQFLTELHTHDTTGVMHVESDKKRNFSLGEFFGVWGVRLTSTCVGGYCKPKTPWRMYVDGAQYTADPSALVLKKHQEIAIVVGKPPKKVPSTYAFGNL